MFGTPLQVSVTANLLEQDYEYLQLPRGFGYRAKKKKKKKKEKKIHLAYLVILWRYSAVYRVLSCRRSLPCFYVGMFLTPMFLFKVGGGGGGGEGGERMIGSAKGKGERGGGRMGGGGGVQNVSKKNKTPFDVKDMDSINDHEMLFSS